MKALQNVKSHTLPFMRNSKKISSNDRNKSMSDSNLTFTLNYAITLIVVLSVSIYLMKSAPTLHPGLIIVIGLLVAYLLLTFIQFVMPSFTDTVRNISQYSEYTLYSNVNDLGYFQIWPPILVVLILFVALLYQGNTSKNNYFKNNYGLNK